MLPPTPKKNPQKASYLTKYFFLLKIYILKFEILDPKTQPCLCNPLLKTDNCFSKQEVCLLYVYRNTYENTMLMGVEIAKYFIILGLGLKLTIGFIIIRSI